MIISRRTTWREKLTESRDKLAVPPILFIF